MYVHPALQNTLENNTATESIIEEVEYPFAKENKVVEL